MTDRGGRVDWEAVRTRTLGNRDDAEGSRLRLEAVYRARAIDLAARREAASVEADTLPVLAFTLGDERYGLALTDLVGVLSFGRCTPVPGGPGELLGVINHRSRICSILDLARLLSLPPPSGDSWRNGTEEGGGTAYILLLRRAGSEVGLRVDRVETIRRIAPDDLVALGDLALQDATGTRAETRFAQERTRDGLTLLRAEAIWAHSIFAGASPS